jgi:DNA-binding CsgD family transcriptional regulator
MDAQASQHRPLVGRRLEQARVDRLVRDVVAGRGPCLGVWGPPGSGKSALLARASADGVLLLRAAGDPAEFHVRAALLHQLMASQLHPGAAGTTHDQALLGAAARSIAGLAESADAAAGALSALLHRMAQDAPTLVVVDDVDRADPFSVAVLGRLVPAGRPWGLLLAGQRLPHAFVRARAERAPADDLYLCPLSGKDSRRLAEAAAAARDGRHDNERRSDLIDDIVGWAAGNPGALVRLARALVTTEVLRAGAAVDVARRASAAVAPLWLPRYDLSPQAQQLGLLWAVACDCPGPPSSPVVPEQLVEDAALAELLDAGLLVRDTDQVVPVHPLLPAAALGLLPSGEQRRAHAMLADSVDPGGLRAAWHRARSATTSDEIVAGRLDQAVAAVGTELLPGARARALEQSATLSADPGPRSLRWARAAEARLAAGDTSAAVALLQRVYAASAPEEAQARALLTEGLLAAASQSAQQSFERLVRATALARGRDDELEITALASAAEVAWWSGRADWAVQAADLTSQVRRLDGSFLMIVEAARGAAQVFSGNLHSAGRHLRAALAAGEGATSAQDHRMAGQAALLLGDDVASNRHLAESARLSRAEGDVFRLSFTLQMLASVETWRGHLDGAEELLAQVRVLARRTGDERSRASALSMSAHLQGLRGAGDAATAAARAALRLVTGRDVGYLPSSALWALGRADLAAGRMASALEYLTEVTDPEAARTYPVTALFAIPDLVEAAARSGRPELAHAALPRFQDWAMAGSPWAKAVLPRLFALVAAGDEAEQWYADGISDPDRPFERARTQLLYGEHLRRHRQRVRARAVLAEARATFEALGVVPWAERAATELVATVERARRGPGSATELTPHELTIARLVADGASNQEVAEQLFLSRKTVESHLNKVYTKLGISSRKQLAAVLPPED